MRPRKNTRAPGPSFDPSRAPGPPCARAPRDLPSPVLVRARGGPRARTDAAPDGIERDAETIPEERCDGIPNDDDFAAPQPVHALCRTRGPTNKARRIRWRRSRRGSRARRAPGRGSISRAFDQAPFQARQLVPPRVTTVTTPVSSPTTTSARLGRVPSSRRRQRMRRTASTRTGARLRPPRPRRSSPTRAYVALRGALSAAPAAPASGRARASRSPAMLGSSVAGPAPAAIRETRVSVCERRRKKVDPALLRNRRPKRARDSADEAAARLPRAPTSLQGSPSEGFANAECICVLRGRRGWACGRDSVAECAAHVSGKRRLPPHPQPLRSPSLRPSSSVAPPHLHNSEPTSGSLARSPRFTRTRLPLGSALSFIPPSLLPASFTPRRRT